MPLEPLTEVTKEETLDGTLQDLTSCRGVKGRHLCAQMRSLAVDKPQH